MPGLGGDAARTHLKVRAVEHRFEQGLVVGVQAPALDRSQQNEGLAVVDLPVGMNDG